MMSEGYNTPKIGRSGPTSPAASEKTTSSRAVLAALRALQDKIARLEGERAEAVHATSELRARLREAEARLDSAGIEPTPVRGGGDELDELREAQHRLEREYTERDAAAKAAERRAAESEHRAKQAAARAARAEELLAASRSSKPADTSKYMRKIAKLEKKLRTAERLLETVLQMNKLLVEGQAPPPPPSPRVRTQPPPPPARARPRRRARRTQPPPPRVRSRSPLSKPKRRSRSPRPRDEARPLPWVPSSDGGVSFNLAAACQYALRRTQHASAAA